MWTQGGFYWKKHKIIFDANNNKTYGNKTGRGEI